MKKVHLMAIQKSMLHNILKHVAQHINIVANYVKKPYLCTSKMKVKPLKPNLCMTKRVILHFLMLAGLAAIEIAFAAGMFLLMVGIVFGMMAGCATIQELIHIFF